MRNAFKVTLFLLIVTAAGCGKSDPPPAPASDATRSTAPVKNVESLPSGSIREGARTMNTGAELGSTLEQQKQERDKEIESEAK
jgi:predicted small lipoprotein YifL